MKPKEWNKAESTEKIYESMIKIVKVRMNIESYRNEAM